MTILSVSFLTHAHYKKHALARQANMSDTSPLQLPLEGSSAEDLLESTAPPPTTTGHQCLTEDGSQKKEGLTEDGSQQKDGLTEDGSQQKEGLTEDGSQQEQVKEGLTEDESQQEQVKEGLTEDGSQQEQVKEGLTEDESQQEQVKEGFTEDEMVDESNIVQTKTTPITSEANPIPVMPQPVVQDDWSKLSREVVVDKIKGIIYGQAIGDALGLATEFMSQKEAVRYYKKDGPSEYSQIVQDFHRSRWMQGDWTDDTDQLLLILQMIVERKGTVEKCAFAEKMINWKMNGFKELNDVGGMGIGMTVSQTLGHHCFLTNPHEAAKEVWERSGRYLAANGAIMRTAILGILEFNDLERVIINTREICLVTHADPRCLASCIAVTTAIALMLQGAYDPGKKKELERLVNDAIGHAKTALEHEDQKKELVEHIKASKLKDLDLENRRSMGYTFKALGAGFFGLRNASDFKSTLKKVIMQAGDADSNGAVCGALMGCRFGFSGLPQDLLNFPHRGWLDDQVAQFLKTIGLQN